MVTEPIPINFGLAPEQSVIQSDIESVGNVHCPLCPVIVLDSVNALCCDQCVTWYHADCLLIPDDEYQQLALSSDKWNCDHCRSIQANKINWGKMKGEDSISSKVKYAYEEILRWKKNIFTLPRGKSGTDFIRELTRLLYLFVDKTSWQRIALSLVHVFIPLMLQKPGPKSKARDHVKYLTSRLAL